MTNTRDRYKSTPSSKTNWDPNWKRAPPPLRSRPDVMASVPAPTPPGVPRASRPANASESPSPPPYTPPPPPTRAASGYPPSHRESLQDAADKIDWANLSPEDKEAFFEWLDEFFSRHLGIELSPRERRCVPSSVHPASPVSTCYQSTPCVMIMMSVIVANGQHGDPAAITYNNLSACA